MIKNKSLILFIFQTVSGKNETEAVIKEIIEEKWSMLEQKRVPNMAD